MRYILMLYISVLVAVFASMFVSTTTTTTTTTATTKTKSVDQCSVDSAQHATVASSQCQNELASKHTAAIQVALVNGLQHISATATTTPTAATTTTTGCSSQTLQQRGQNGWRWRQRHDDDERQRHVVGAGLERLRRLSDVRAVAAHAPLDDKPRVSDGVVVVVWRAHLVVVLVANTRDGGQHIPHEALRLVLHERRAARRPVAQKHGGDGSS